MIGCNRKLTEQSGAYTAAGRAERAKRRGNPNVMFPQRHLLTIGFGELLRNGLALGARVLEPLLRKEPLARRRRIERHLLQQLGEFLKGSKPHRFIVVAILEIGWSSAKSAVLRGSFIVHSAKCCHTLPHSVH